MRSRVTLVLAITAVVLGGVLLVPTAYARLASDDGSGGGGGGTSSVAAPAPAPPPPPTLAPGPVSVSFKGEFFSWALLDRKTGKISGSPNMTATSSTESMIKAWIVSDYLRQLGDKEPSAAMKEAARVAIVDSNDGAANKVYAAAGGSYKVPPNGLPGPVIQRAIKICGLTDTKRGNVPKYEGWWSFTRMSPATRSGSATASPTVRPPVRSGPSGCWTR